jgi:hypothetical protein
MRNAYDFSVGIPAHKTWHERPRLRWEDNIKNDDKEIGGGGKDVSCTVSVRL